MLYFLLDTDDDWQEGFRRYWYPRFHHHLVWLGGRVGVPMYAVGHVGYDQYVGHFDEDEEAIEEELVAAGGERNPLAALKELPDGRVSEGSWRFTHRSRPDLVEPGKQLHFTMFKREDRRSGRVLFAHYEDNWEDDPVGHLRSAHFSAQEGVDRGRELIDESTFLIRIRK